MAEAEAIAGSSSPAQSFDYVKQLSTEADVLPVAQSLILHMCQ